MYYRTSCIVYNSDFQIVFSNQISLKMNFIMNANLKGNSQYELQLPKYLPVCESRKTLPHEDICVYRGKSGKSTRARYQSMLLDSRAYF